jgi:hypothetical protein
MPELNETADGQANDCTHLSASGIDTAPLGPDKVWRCDHCGLRWSDAGYETVEQLRRWKAEALPVIAGLQDLGRALGLGLGVQITGPVAVEAARVLRSAAAEAERYRSANREHIDTIDELRAELDECRKRADLAAARHTEMLVAVTNAEAERDRALAEHRREWADYFEHWSGAVGPEPLTVKLVIEALRAESVPFGRAARQEQGR